MDWTNIIVTLMTLLMGGGLGVLSTLRAARKKADAEAEKAKAEAIKEKAEAEKARDEIWAARLDQMREEVDYERKRNVELDEQHKREIDYERERNRELMERNKELIERMTDKENRFQEQTIVLRKHVAEVIELTKVNGEKDTELAKVRCEDLPCPFRRPPNAHTMPMPGVSKEDWHRDRGRAEGDKKEKKQNA